MAGKRQVEKSMLIHDDTFNWEGWGGKLRLGSGKCRLRIYDLQKGGSGGLAHLRPIIFVVSDMPDSPMSVRSCAGHIATTVIRKFDVDQNRMMFIEYSEPKSYGENDEHQIPERYEIIEFTWHGDKALTPVWRSLTPPLLDTLVVLMAESSGKQ